MVRSWIDAPLAGSSLSLGEVEVVSHSASTAGVAQVELSVDGDVVATDPVSEAGATLSTQRQSWKPSGPGNYTLAVRAKGGKGSWGEPSRVVITIGGEPTSTPTPIAVATQPLPPRPPPP